jgi:hypothetical protein
VSLQKRWLSAGEVIINQYTLQITNNAYEALCFFALCAHPDNIVHYGQWNIHAVKADDGIERLQSMYQLRLKPQQTLLATVTIVDNGIVPTFETSSFRRCSDSYVLFVLFNITNINLLKIRRNTSRVNVKLN